jgi:hypothetical protein
MKSSREWEEWWDSTVPGCPDDVGALVGAVRKEQREALRDHLRQRAFNAVADGLPTLGKHLSVAADIVESFGEVK